MDQHKIVFESQTPVYGENYDRGWIGFNHASSFMARGIALVTYSQRQRGIPISHAFIVTGEDSCVEAAFGKGVVRSSLTKQYFDNPERYVVFRKPRGLDADLAERIVQCAEQEVGAEFNNKILFSSVARKTLLTTIVDSLYSGDADHAIASLCEEDDAWICSELAAYVLRQQPEFHDVGVLKRPCGAVEPQLLFESDELFEPLEVST
ncbi:hypothetical protein NG895_16470 [Aeoliella sp. ICT_H6.2]|uniref:Uncharacterized protein n=1 Tax=Aeoliella straminimaris TaxID=2954799 RepID=A0A9X2JHI9_9BACT|nr:hypothetical protein [Aeoliella straminimaris]MCO6045507.1 hypothetical protein [Aeoliella straminimaris]